MTLGLTKPNEGDVGWAGALNNDLDLINNAFPVSLANGGTTPVGGSGTYLRSNGSTAQWATLSTNDLAAQSANQVLAGPSSGSAAVPTWRSLVPADFGSQSANQVLAGPSSGPAVAPTWRGLGAADVTYASTDNIVANAEGLLETSGPTQLRMGAVADGQILKRSGSSIVGVASGVSVVASQRVTGKTVNQSGLATYTVGASDQSLEVGGDLTITSYTSGSIQIAVNYTDENGTARSPHFWMGGPTSSPASADQWPFFTMSIRAKTGTTVSFSTSGTYVLTFNLEVFAKALN